MCSWQVTCLTQLIKTCFKIAVNCLKYFIAISSIFHLGYLSHFILSQEIQMIILTEVHNYRLAITESS
jgi:hypothetical protein